MAVLGCFACLQCKKPTDESLEQGRNDLVNRIYYEVVYIINVSYEFSINKILSSTTFTELVVIT